jgi:Mce-associated membrane protein
MADDAAAPDGELSETSAAEPESTAIEDTKGVSDKSEDVSDVSDAVTDAGADDAGAEDAEAEDAEAEDYDAEDEAADTPAKPRMSHVRLAMIAGLVLVLALGGLSGWLGFRAYESHQADQQRKLFLQVGRQGALNLTSINFENAEGDVQRILDSATGTFYDDFQKRAQPFIDVVKQAQSKSVGSIAEAGLVPESVSENEAEVLVAVTVKTSNAGAPEQEPRAWRMRISVQKVGDEAKVSNVEFVP